MRRAWLGVLAALALGCARDVTRRAPAAGSSATSAPSLDAAPRDVGAVPARAEQAPVVYSWLARDSHHEALSARLAPPVGFARIALAPESFGAFLRELPLEPEGARVLAFDGAVIRQADDPGVAAVVALDVGRADLQQCADSIVRLHAEWRWSQGARDHAYVAAAGLSMPLSRFVAGERVVANGKALEWRVKDHRRPLDHALFRGYLDAVFAWANTGSLARDARAVEPTSLRPGDFFVLPGAPGHAVLVLDVARRADGRRVALLGQGFMPAQSFQVLRPSRDTAWFALDPASTGVKTPFWREFPWGSLRRLDPG